MTLEIFDFQLIDQPPKNRLQLTAEILTLIRSSNQGDID